MKSKFYATIIIAACCILNGLHAQTNIFPSTGNAGIGTTMPLASAALEMKSTSKGLLIPRMTKTQRDAVLVSTAAKGLLIYQTNSTPGFYYYDGSAWTAVRSKGASISLNNLTTTAIDSSLLPAISNSINLGSNTLRWKDINLYNLKFSDGTTQTTAFVKGWSLTGNAGIDSSKNFIGTTDAHPLIFRVNKLRAGYIGYGTSNTSFGYQAFSSNTSGNYNTATGTYSLSGNTTGYNNAAFGSYALTANNVGSFNAAFGSDALHNNTSGNYNTANGAATLYTNTTGYYNTANGYQSLYTNTSGFANTASGYQSLYFNTSGYQNTAVGLNALRSNTSGYNNTATGLGALLLNNLGNSNTANGYGALAANTAGNNNTAVGNFALLSNTTGYSNVALGVSALSSNTIANNLVAIGDSALYNNGHGAVNSSDGSYNTAIGSKVLYSNTTGFKNTATGSEALYSNTKGGQNTATGYQALYSNTKGGQNTATGYQALYYNTEGAGNTANGIQALFLNTTGSNNTASGYSTLIFNSTGVENTAIGSLALNVNQTGSDNTAIGYQALLSNGSSNGNTAVGFETLSNNQSPFNTAVGYQALYTNTSGYNNTAVGINADLNSNNLVDVSMFGQGATGSANNQVRIGGNAVTSIGGYANWTNISDGRVKKNIKKNVPGLAFINKLQPITYNLNLDAADKIIQRAITKDKEGKTIQPSQFELDSRKAKEQIIYTGFVAQDVEKAAKSLNYDFSGVDAAKNDKDLYGLRYSDFVVPLVKAVQELSTENDSLKNQNNTQQTQINNLQDQINELKAMIVSNQTSVINQQSTVISSASLQQNIPNPFTHSTTIGYNLPQKFTNAQIVITDKSGKTLKAVTISGSGKGSLNVDASTLPSGAYQYSLVIDGRLIATKQMISAK